MAAPRTRGGGLPAPTFPGRESKPTSGRAKPAENGERRKRNCAKKTRTGCLTCKQRRVRCDEHKPQCWNCLKSKERVCQGYQTIKQESSEASTNFKIHLETYSSNQASSSSMSSNSSSRGSLSSSNTSTSTTPTGIRLPSPITLPNASQYTPSLPASESRQAEEPSYFFHHPYGSGRSPYTGVGFAAPILTTPVADYEQFCELPPIRSRHYLTNEPQSSHADARAEQIVSIGPEPAAEDLAQFLSASATRRSNRLDSSHAMTRQIAPKLIRNPDSTPFTKDAQSAKSFAFYMSHSGAAMGARSSNLFFLYTIPQVAGHYDYVRYALLAAALVDESVDDFATNGSQYGPGIECRDADARRKSFEMYGRSVRALCDAHTETHATFRDSDNALAATLITCILLFSFENWLWNVQSAGRHIDGARALIDRYEKSAAGQQRRSGLLHDQVLIMMRSAMKYHDESVHLQMPASRCPDGEVPRWAPEQDLVMV